MRIFPEGSMGQEHGRGWPNVSRSQKNFPTNLSKKNSGGASKDSGPNRSWLHPHNPQFLSRVFFQR